MLNTFTPWHSLAISNHLAKNVLVTRPCFSIDQKGPHLCRISPGTFITSLVLMGKAVLEKIFLKLFMVTDDEDDR